jgi:hypothetical protein
MLAIGFPDEGLPDSSAFPMRTYEKCEIDNSIDFHDFHENAFFVGFHEKLPPLIGFPDPTPQNPSDFRPSNALLIGIRSAGIPLTHTQAAL